MAPPSGVGIPPGQCLHISRGRYGPKQATRDWHECRSLSLTVPITLTGFNAIAKRIQSQEPGGKILCVKITRERKAIGLRLDQSNYLNEVFS